MSSVSNAVDLAAEAGGNVETTVAGEVVTVTGKDGQRSPVLDTLTCQAEW